MKEENYDLFVKILLVGDSGAGKTCLILRYTDDEYNDTYQSTIGVDFKIKTKVMSNSKVAKMQLWDTAGQERFNSIVVSYYRGVNGILVVFDLTNETSFQNTTKWIQQIKSNAQENTLIALVGNKSDMVHRRVVDRSRAEEFAKKLNIPYFEASAKDGTGVKEPFDNMLDRLYQAGNYAESEFNRRKNTAGSSSGTVNLNAPVNHPGASSSGKTSNSSSGGGCGC